MCSTIVDGIVDNPLPQMIYFWDSLPAEEKLALSLLAETLSDETSWESADRLLADATSKGVTRHRSVSLALAGRPGAAVRKGAARQVSRSHVPVPHRSAATLDSPHAFHLAGRQGEREACRMPASERPVEPRNPYLNRVMIREVSDFYGRRREVAKIFARIGAARPQSVAIVGERRIGKSSLLNYLCHPEIRRQHSRESGGIHVRPHRSAGAARDRDSAFFENLFRGIEQAIGQARPRRLAGRLRRCAAGAAAPAGGGTQDHPPVRRIRCHHAQPEFSGGVLCVPPGSGEQVRRRVRARPRAAIFSNSVTPIASPIRRSSTSSRTCS